MTINCVVVTYNRLALLKECLDALDKQTYPIHKIVIVDNCSTDGTGAFLESLANQSRYMIIRTTENIGGSGGFSLGLKTAVLDGCDYAWLMDDDTIPQPTALEELVKAVSLDKTPGFICSRVNWTDGTPHVMNKASVIHENGNPVKVTKGNVSAFRCNLCSFVSVLINSEAVYQLGLPVKEFFIWCDDIEYTLRIARAGYPCFYVETSVVYHKTVSNYAPSIDKAPATMAWRFYYQARNRCYMKRQQIKVKLFFVLSVLNMYRVYKHRIGKRKDNHSEEFLKAVKKGCIDGLHFVPSIEYLNKPK